MRFVVAHSCDILSPVARATDASIFFYKRCICQCPKVTDLIEEMELREQHLGQEFLHVADVGALQPVSWDIFSARKRTNVELQKSRGFLDSDENGASDVPICEWTIIRDSVGFCIMCI